MSEVCPAGYLALAMWTKHSVWHTGILDECYRNVFIVFNVGLFSLASAIGSNMHTYVIKRNLSMSHFRTHVIE